MKQKAYGFWDKLPTAKPLAWLFALFTMWLVGWSFITGKVIPDGAVSIMLAMGPTMVVSYMGKSAWEHQTNVRAEVIEEGCEDGEVGRH